MYHQYFGLKEAPFSIAVNPRYLFMSSRHRDALAHLLYGVGAGGGFILLTGEVGTGKTTINRCLLEQLPADTDIAIILNPALNAQELLATACDELGIEYDRAHPTLKSLTDRLHDFLLANYSRGRKTVLMIDEAQHLDFEVLEQIRLLTNLETNTEKLLQIILIGQPELVTMLQRPELRQLNQRITARFVLEPLNLGETRAYIQHRLQVAGLAAGTTLFPPAVVRGIHRRTQGIPRLINVLCDRVLLGAYGQNKSRADRHLLANAAREVLGEKQGAAQTRQWGLWGGLALLLLLGGGAVATYWQSGSTPVSGPQQVAPAAGVERRAGVTAETGGGTTVVAAQPRDTTAPPAAEPTAPGAADAGWQLAPAQAARVLWTINSPVEPPARPCDDSVVAGLVCERGLATTWDELLALERPLVLQLVTPDRFAAAAVLLGIDARDAVLWHPDGERVVALSGLADLWTGDYHFLWHPPDGFSRPLGRGDRGPVVARVAALFAELDQQPQPLAEGEFNQALQQRVEMFQRAHGLEDDGMVGLQTLLKLNARLGIDTTLTAARQALASSAGEVTTR
jgi:general secretion pathway protein A